MLVQIFPDIPAPWEPTGAPQVCINGPLTWRTPAAWQVKLRIHKAIVVIGEYSAPFPHRSPTFTNSWVYMSSIFHPIVVQRVPVWVRRSPTCLPQASRWWSALLDLESRSACRCHQAPAEHRPCSRSQDALAGSSKWWCAGGWEATLAFAGSKRCLKSFHAFSKKIVWSQNHPTCVLTSNGKKWFLGHPNFEKH